MFLLLGMSDGTVELITENRNRIQMKGSPQSPVTRMFNPPQRALAVGYANGLVSFHDRSTGAYLARNYVHGPVFELLLTKEELRLVSTTGACSQRWTRNMLNPVLLRSDGTNMARYPGSLGAGAGKETGAPEGSSLSVGEDGPPIKDRPPPWLATRHSKRPESGHRRPPGRPVDFGSHSLESIGRRRSVSRSTARPISLRNPVHMPHLGCTVRRTDPAPRTTGYSGQGLDLGLGPGQPPLGKP